jgi:hypothetical protein
MNSAREGSCFVDLMFFVNKKLDQVNYFYDTVVPAFEEIKRRRAFRLRVTNLPKA